MKIFSASQIRAIDQYTIKNEPISSIDLMERASMAFVNWFMEKFCFSREVVIFCGMGNNGGDGLAIARMLLERGKEVKVYLVKYTDKPSPDNEENYHRLEKHQELVTINRLEEVKIGKEAVVIDAIFGSGLNRPAEGLTADIINKINKSGATIVAVDIPSGLFCDQPVDDKSAIIDAEYTFTFQCPKLAFMLPDYEKYVGEWYVADIGLHPDIIENTNSAYYYIEKKDICNIIRKRSKFSHKGTFGHALMIGGSYGKIGAQVLATRACLKTGAGLVTTYLPECGYDIMQLAVPESMAVTDPERKFITSVPETGSYNAIGVGPGLGKEEKTKDALKSLLENAKVPLVIDADALNIISGNRELMDMVPENSILTPHPKEFERLAGKAENSYERLDLLRNLAEKHKIYILLKGAHSAIATPEKVVYFNSTGNAGMATGGSGDVLTGILTSLLAQGYTSLEASMLGVYIHGLAGDIAAENLSQEFMSAGDIIDNLANAFKELGSQFIRL